MAQIRRLPEVTQPLAPLTKHSATATVSTVAAARLLVACSIISVRGLCVGDASSRSRSTKQNSMTMMKNIPLRTVRRRLLEGWSKLTSRLLPRLPQPWLGGHPWMVEAFLQSYVPQHPNFSMSAMPGRNRCTTYPMKLRADCNSPSIQAVPSLHPVVLEKLVKTNSASVFGEVARRTILMTTTLSKDQYTKKGQFKWRHICSSTYKRLRSIGSGWDSQRC